jgi:hypothetical protein
MTMTLITTDRYSSDLNLVSAAQAAIDSFEQSPKSGVWPFLQKTNIIRDMRIRIADPFQVNQGGQPFCGPAAVLFELIRCNPVRYVKICQQLFETGIISGTTQSISSDAVLRQNSRGDLRMEQADWMVLATLREAANLLFPVEPNTPSLLRNMAGMTKPWEIIGWCIQILGYSQVQQINVFLMQDQNSLRSIDTVLQAGGVAFSLITAEGLLEDKVSLPLPSHWVSLLGNVKTNNNLVSFDLYTWSQKQHLEVDIEKFKKYFWVCITALPISDLALTQAQSQGSLLGSESVIVRVIRAIGNLIKPLLGRN